MLHTHPQDNVIWPQLACYHSLIVALKLTEITNFNLLVAMKDVFPRTGSENT